MRKRPTASRRSFLAGVGAATAAALAGCSGDGDSEGENSDGTDTAEVDDGGADATTTDASTTQTEREVPKPQGKLVVSDTITDTNKEWLYELEQGETITVIANGDGEYTTITGSLLGPEVGDHINNVGRGGMQITAKQNGTHEVYLATGGTLAIEIYIDR